MKETSNDAGCPIPLLCVTTSERKFSHLAYLGQENDIDVVHIPREYHELQKDDIDILLDEALERKELASLKDTFYIIEQTSVFLEAFDGEPGQFFKRWWQMQDDDELKRKLSRNPIAVIESGIALNVPNHEPLKFSNRQQGQINFEGRIRKGNEQYPWLSAEDLNMFFVPKGAKKVYSQMELREFREYDFRRPHFEEVADRIQEYGAIIEADLKISDLWEKAKNMGFPGPTSRTYQLGLNDYDD